MTSRWYRGDRKGERGQRYRGRGRPGSRPLDQPSSNIFLDLGGLVRPLALFLTFFFFFFAGLTLHILYDVDESRLKEQRFRSLDRFLF